MSVLLHECDKETSTNENGASDCLWFFEPSRINSQPGHAEEPSDVVKNLQSCVAHGDERC